MLFINNSSPHITNSGQSNVKKNNIRLELEQRVLDHHIIIRVNCVDIQVNNFLQWNSSLLFSSIYCCLVRVKCRKCNSLVVLMTAPTAAPMRLFSVSSKRIDTFTKAHEYCLTMGAAIIRRQAVSFYYLPRELSCRQDRTCLSLPSNSKSSAAMCGT